MTIVILILRNDFYFIIRRLEVLQEKLSVNYICLQCDEQEKIQYDAVRSFDAMDGGDPLVPPQFTCGECGGTSLGIVSDSEGSSSYGRLIFYIFISTARFEHIL